jgi:hypothetical protein
MANTLLKAIQEIVQEALEAANPDKIPGAINWGDLSCVEVCRCEDQDGMTEIRILVEEASPDNEELHKYIISWLEFQSKVQINEPYTVITEW